MERAWRHVGQASRRFPVGADVGTWVFGFRFHCDPLVVFTIKENTKIKHCLQQAILEEHRLKKLRYLLLCFLSFVLSCLGRRDDPSFVCGSS